MHVSRRLTPQHRAFQDYLVLDVANVAVPKACPSNRRKKASSPCPVYEASYEMLKSVAMPGCTDLGIIPVLTLLLVEVSNNYMPRVSKRVSK
jgi:hypothetical protein